jgi:hypothetical protein
VTRENQFPNIYNNESKIHMSEVWRKNKLLKYVSQKGFVHETGCFNNVHILKEAIKATKQSKGLVAIEFDAAKPFVSVS